MDRGLPPPQFKLRPSHALYLLDLALAVVVFIFVGRYYVERKGAVIRAKGAQEESAAQAEIKVQSTPGRGSCFQVAFPLASAPKQNSAQSYEH